MLLRRAVSFYVCLLVHDESTFRSGEVSNKRWFFGEKTPFYSKGRGRSNMVSDFLVQQGSGPFFTLNQKEYEKAIAKYHQVCRLSHALPFYFNKKINLTFS